MKDKLYIIENIINLNEMTRSGQIRKETKKIIVCNFFCSDIFRHLNDINKQSEKYLSYNFVILNNGNIINIIPQNEISYSTNSIENNLNSISIGIYCREGEGLNLEQIINLKLLLKYICKKYNLSLIKDVFIESDLYSTRNFSYYIDNYYLWQNIIK